MLLYVTGLQPTITKNTAVFHSNSVKYYHFKQAAAAPCPQQPRRREPGEERAAKGLPTAEGEWATGLVTPWDAFSWRPRLHQATKNHCSTAKCSHMGSSCWALQQKGIMMLTLHSPSCSSVPSAKSSFSHCLGFNKISPIPAPLH